MNIDQLRAFYQVTQSGSFTQAARELHLTQPAVSQQIKALEESLHVTLFDRTEKKIRLTRDGNFILSYVQKLFNLYDQIKLVSKHLNSIEKGTISIGATTVIGTYFLPKLIGRFSKKYPGVEINLRIGNSKKIQALLKNGKIDFGFAGKLMGTLDLEHSIIHTEKLEIITSPDNKILKKTGLSFSDFIDTPFIFREKGTQTRILVERLFKEKTGKQASEKFIELHNLEATKRMVEEGYGISVIPEIAVREEISAGKLTCINLKEFDFCLNYYLFKGTFLTRASEAFLEMIYSSDIFKQDFD